MISWHRFWRNFVVFPNLRSTLFVPFHSVSSAYLPPPSDNFNGVFSWGDWLIFSSDGELILAFFIAFWTRSVFLLLDMTDTGIALYTFYITHFTLYRWCSLVSWCCNLLCHWLVSLQSDWLIDRKWRLLIGQIAWLLIGWWWNTSFYHPIIDCPDVTGSILVFSTITRNTMKISNTNVKQKQKQYQTDKIVIKNVMYSKSK